MGGEAHGEIASAMAVETVVNHCLNAETNPGAPVIGAVQPDWSARTKSLSTAVHLANRNIFKSAEENPDRHGMGATLTAVWIDDAKLSIAHVGDSRAICPAEAACLRSPAIHPSGANKCRAAVLTPPAPQHTALQT